MYRTKEFCPKKVHSSINIGDDYKYKGDQKPDRYLGKQFAHSTSNNEFSRLPYASDPLQEGIKYSKLQPREQRQNGFGSNMASCTDEFSNTIRTQQWREILKAEQASDKINCARLKAAKNTKFPKLTTDTKNANRVTMYVGGRPMSDRTYDRLPKLFQRNVPTSLYDIGKEEFNGVTPTCNRCHRDRFFCKHRANTQNNDIDGVANDGEAKLTPRYTGPFVVSSETLGNFGDIQWTKPEFGRRMLTKEFFDTVKGGSLVK